MSGPNANRRTQGRARARAFVVAWLCTLAIAFQCIVVQSHIHGPAFRLAELQSASTAAETIGTQAKVDRAHDPAPTNEKPSGCFICQQITMAGAAVLPTSAIPVPIEREFVGQPAATETAATHTQVSHIWRSRAPPTSLQG